MPEKSIPSSENTGPMGGCLVKADDQNKTIFLMNDFFVSLFQQKCSFREDQSILIPLYTAECDTGDKGLAGKPFTEVLTCALDADRGEAYMKVRVDNLTLVDTKASVHKTPSHNNLSEVESKDFSTLMYHQIVNSWDQIILDLESSKEHAHGWYVFLKPLDEGNHVISYYTKVTGTQTANIEEAPWDYEADVTYSLNVEK